MSASTMAKQGEKTRAKILKKLGKRPKSVKTIAESLGLSEQYVRQTLSAAAQQGKATVKKYGRLGMFYSAVSESSVASAYKSVGSFAD